jgi:hypothetical protein
MRLAMKRAMRLAMMDEAAVPSRAGLGGAFVVRCSPRSVIEDGSNNVTAGVGSFDPCTSDRTEWGAS